MENLNFSVIRIRSRRDGPIRPMAGGFVSEQPTRSRNVMQSPTYEDLLMTSDQNYDDDDDEISDDYDEENKEMEKKSTSSSSWSSLISRDTTVVNNNNDLNKAVLNLSAETTHTIETYRTASDNVNNYMDMIEEDLRQLALNHSGENRVKFLYSDELNAELDDGLEMSTCSDTIERNMFTCFQSPPPLGTSKNPEWREGSAKSAFNYLLIDPRLTRNLPVRAKVESMSQRDILRVFVASVFYVGKGSRARPYAHLYDACRYWKGERGRNADAVLAAAADSKLPKRVRLVKTIKITPM